MMFLWRRYQTLLKAHPLRVNMATSGTVMLCADAAAQRIESEGSGESVVHDHFRSTTMVTWNTFVFAPCFYYWFGFLDRCFPGTAVRNVALKVLVNQLLITVPINSAFLGYSVSVDALLRSAAGGHSWDGAAARSEVLQRCTEDLGEIFQRSACIWTPVNAANFMFVPQHLRVLPTILTSCAWNTYLSLTAHHETTSA